MVKGEKMVQNYTKFCLSRSLSQEHHVISFMLHMCKMTISSGFFFSFFQNFHFRVVRGVKGQKIDQNDKKISVALHISETIHHMIVIYG